MDDRVKETTITITKLTASEGMTLTNGDAFSKEVYLGVNDKPENWTEIPDAEAEEQRKAKLPQGGEDCA
jgi:hypothetical protein